MNFSLMERIDPKSFIIGLLSAAVVLLSLGAASDDNKKLGDVTVNSLTLKKDGKKLAVLKGKKGAGQLMLYEGGRKLSAIGGENGSGGLALFEKNKPSVSLNSRKDGGMLRFIKKGEPIVSVGNLVGGTEGIKLYGKDREQLAILDGKEGKGYLKLYENGQTSAFIGSEEGEEGNLILLKNGKVKWKK
ncbi:MAG: hypothetical protein ABEH38_09415 [Flavobacteriales bacterium]